MIWWDKDNRNRKHKYQAYALTNGKDDCDTSLDCTIYETSVIKTFETKSQLDSFLKENNYHAKKKIM